MIDQLLLFPYSLTLAIRNFAYDKNICKSQKAPVPTICVGNVSVGGTGKTPHTEAILKLLQQSDKWGMSNLALLSRGYRRSSQGFRIVPVNGSAALYGDEPLMIKKKMPYITVAVDRDRIGGCKKLCNPDMASTAELFPAAELIVLDDAFQYRKLKADLNVVLTDYNRPHWHDHLLPLGRLRDLPDRLFDADIIVVTKCPTYMDDSEKCEFVHNLGLRNYNTMDCSARTKKDKEILVIFTGLKYEKLKPVYDCADPHYIYSKKMILFTGIAKDGPLLSYLSDTYKMVGHLTFPDHHIYHTSDINHIMEEVHRNPTAGIATTEKDAQRILDYNGMPEKIKERLFSVPISIDFLTENERKIFFERISRI